MSGGDGSNPNTGLAPLLAGLLLGAGTGILAGWLLSAHGALAWIVSGILAGLICALFAFAALNKSRRQLEEVSQALDHVSQEPAENPPTQPTSTVAKKLTTQVYKLASASQGMTEHIDNDRIELRSVIDLMPLAVMVFDKEQKLTLANKTAEEMLGFKFKEVKGLEHHKVLDWLFQTDQTYDVWLEQSRGNKLKDTMFWERVSLINRQNERIIGDAAAHYEKETATGLETVVVFIDRTDEYTADEAQLDFVAVAAHELRNPITVIRGYLDVLKTEMASTFTVEQQALLQKMTVSAEMLSLYVNNILNVARVDQQVMPLHIREADWREVLKEAYTDLFLRAQTHGRVLKLEMPANLPHVAIDRISIIEVINNLVDNAIKYSNEGGEIIIRAEEHEGLVSTTVEDKGIGIPEGVVGNLFKKFYRSHKTRAGVSGTGLGLYLSKSIVDAHGGNIWVRSKSGEGSTFGFDLPTYDSVAETLKSGDNNAQSIKHTHQGWIKNHSMYRR